MNAYNSAFEKVGRTMSHKGIALIKMDGFLDWYGRSNIGNGPYRDSISPTRNHFGVTTDCVWYNSSIKYIEVAKIDIEFCDGTRKTLTTDEQMHFINPELIKADKKVNERKQKGEERKMEEKLKQKLEYRNKLKLDKKIH